MHYDDDDDNDNEWCVYLWMSATPAGTGDAKLSKDNRPILWLVQVALDSRNAR